MYEEFRDLIRQPVASSIFRVTVLTAARLARRG
jgi:hypothetical protein